MTAKLLRPVRDPSGFPHGPGEDVTVTRRVKHADFDNRPLIFVRFANNATGAVFEDEISCQNSAE